MEASAITIRLAGSKYNAFTLSSTLVQRYTSLGESSDQITTLMLLFLRLSECFYHGLHYIAMDQSGIQHMALKWLALPKNLLDYIFQYLGKFYDTTTATCSRTDMEVLLSGFYTCINKTRKAQILTRTFHWSLSRVCNIRQIISGEMQYTLQYFDLEGMQRCRPQWDGE